MTTPGRHNAPVGISDDSLIAGITGDFQMARLDQFFDVYERFTPRWLGDALAAGVLVVIVTLFVV